MDSKQGVGIKMEKTTSVYDWPTRVFHWIFALLFIGAFFIAKILGDDSEQFPYHMILGMTLSVAVVLRLFWGVVGSRYARFSSFALKPTALFGYLASVFRSKTVRVLGHNPASSWAALVMMGCALGLACTGVLMAREVESELIPEVHEWLAYGFAFTAAAHVIGVMAHMLRHRDGIALSMVHGQKLPVAGEAGIERSYLLVAVLFVCVLGVFAGYLVRGYDAKEGKLSAFGTTLQLSEEEDEEKQP